MVKSSLDVRKVRAAWILREEGEAYEYRGVANTFERRGKSLCFDLHCTVGGDEDFEIQLDRTSAGWRMRFESYTGPEELVFTPFHSAKEIILCHESLTQTVYLHLPAGFLS